LGSLGVSARNIPVNIKIPERIILKKKVIKTLKKDEPE